MIAPATLLAHQGGWDEVLLILTPIAIFAALLGLANRRANAEVRQRSDGGSTDGLDTQPPEQGPASAVGTEETDPDDGPPRPPPGDTPAGP